MKDWENLLIGLKKAIQIETYLSAETLEVTWAKG